MSKFFILGTYSPESYEGFIKNPEQDRKALAQALAKAMGAKITGMDFLRGSYDFIATIEAILDCGAVPVITNIDSSLNMDANDLKSLITEKTKYH